MTRKTRIIIILICVIALAVCLFIAAIPYIPYANRYLYFGDRITLSVNGRIDGRDIEIENAEVNCTFHEKQQRVNRNGNIFSTNGSDYGMYTFVLETEGKEIDIELMHTNWWEINKADLYFNINTENNKIKYTIADDKGTKKSADNGKTYELYYMF